MSSKRVQFLLLNLYMGFVCLLALILKLNLIEMSVLIFLVPGLIFALKRHELKKDLLETVLWAIPIGIFFDYYLVLSHAWVEATVLPFRVWGISIEIIIWGLLCSFFTLSIYKYFFDTHVAEKISRKYKRYFLIVISLLIIFLFTLALKQAVFIPYMYLLLCILWFLVLFIGAWRRPLIFFRAVGVGILSFPVAILHELVSLQLGHWYFEKGYHIAYLTFFNKYTFPFEELLWLLLVIPIMIILHEYFVDNEK